MPRLTFLSLLALAAAAQPAPDSRFREAGVCSRCHVAQTLEWSVSGHPRAGIGCIGCHGASTGHVTNERNDVKPDRAAPSCATCHAAGCPKTGRRDACASCHHPHALLGPKDQGASRPAAGTGALESFNRHMQEGDRLIAAANWGAAREAFEAALRVYPNHPRATARLAFANRRLNPAMPGFELLDAAFDPKSGLPLHVRVVGLPIEMVLVPAGDADLGDDRLPAARPAHTVAVGAFYLGRTELTQRAWLALDKENPSTHPGDDLPVHNVSWNDAEGWIARLNARVPGAGFRLPTEAEWEFAAAADRGDLAARAWFREAADEGAPHAAATRQADRRGIHDLAGNVWEWCSTLFQPYPYDARDGRESPDKPGPRVLRGGSFADSADYLTRAFRHAERPDRRLPYNGFRLARSVPR